MYAIEFETDIQDGVVNIPDEYKAFANTHARVVILLEDDSESSDLRAFSEHSAGLVDEWSSAVEDAVWK
ncbi:MULTISPECIES: hypothetical protein [Halomonadaceae]|uniref:hypothetical protein n=1 Tax=Halomonadaceae TaxID=28256 RepID=UPI001B8B85CC|nr:MULTISPECIES: hypothetical protein [Halomonas]MBS3667120.1 hypothetical protein [Halomonas boliviensis]MCA8866965.1 hypothetical protein [Halomonas sp. SBBP1]UZH11537.1 hypothetical protein OM794_07305 [Halomonas sp. BDJS001]